MEPNQPTLDRILTPERALIFRITHVRNIPWIDFDRLRRSDFVRNPEEPEKFDRYQAEALVFGSLPAGALTGIACYTGDVKLELEAMARAAGADTRIEIRGNWYF